MKRILLLFVVITCVLNNPTPVFASHGLGGELTWTCLGNGQFKFRMKFYRDCNGINAPTSITLTTNHPSVTSIVCPKILVGGQNDISPNGVMANGVTQCPNCTPANGALGIVEEFIYESAPVSLPGVPPASGWTFSWGECCRSGAINNLSNPGTLGFSNRAVMYPFNGQNTFPCYDSSPFFLEKPSTIICTGYPFKYNPNAVDPELDSLVYDWASPLDENLNVIGFAPNYSVTSQLPSTAQNPLNIPASINPSTGEISYLSYTGGYFVTVIKATAYKCNIKVAEIFREINVVLNNSCPDINSPATLAPNLPPVVSAPFTHPVTGLFTEYIDTVYAGDTVKFQLSALDFQYFLNGSAQTITIEASGNIFGTGFTNPNSGCVIPPCATLSPVTPNPTNPNFVFSDMTAAETNFNWVTTCDHVKGLNLVCADISNRYNFVIKATDNYCPANASNVGTISIVILPAPKLKPPVLRCASVNTNGSVALSWTKPSARDSQNTFYSYDIYASLASGGPYQIVDSVKTGFDANTYTHTLPNLTALLGTNAQQQSIYYYIRTRSGCDGDSVSVPSDTLRTIKLNANVNGANETVLTWNALRVPLLSSHATKYRIYKQFPIGTWTLIDSTALLTYTDTTTKQLCSDSISYRVELPDSSGCISVSSLDGVQITNPNPVAAIVPANPVICQGGTVTLTTIPGISYLWSTNQVTQSITVSTSGTYTVTVTQNGGCTSVGSVPVVVNPLPAPVITGVASICAGTSTIYDAGPGYASYLWSNSAVTRTISVNTAGTYTVTVTDGNGCSKSTSKTLVVNPNPVPVVNGITAICQGQTTTFNAGGGFAGYQWSNGLLTQTITTGIAGPYTVTVTAANGCTATASSSLTVNPLPNPVISGSLDFCQGFNTTLDAGAGYTNYQWSNGSTAQTVTLSNAVTITVTVTNGNGCVNNTSVTTVVNPNPVPNITGTMTTCQGSTTVIDGGSGYSGYLWSTGATSQTIAVGTAGPVVVTVTDINGCVGTDNANITVYAIPTATVSGIDTICAGQSTNFNIAFSGPGPYTYSYLDAGVPQGPFTTGAASVNVNVTPASTSTYTMVNVSNANCAGTISGQANISVTPLPTATITGTSGMCLGSNTNLQVNFTGVAPYTYSYTAGANVIGPFTTNNDPEIINVAPGSTTVYGLTPTVTGAGCVGTTNAATATVTVNPIPSAVITGDNTICNGVSTDLTINFNGTGPYSYTYTNGTNTFGPFSTPNDPHTISVAPGSSTSYTLTAIGDANCPGTILGSADITVNPLPTANTLGTTNICDGENTDLTFVFTGTAPYTYSYGDGTSTFGPFTTNLNPVLLNVSPTSTTVYDLTTISDANCAGTVTGAATVTVIPLPTSTLTGTTEICKGSTTDLDLVFTGVPPFEYAYTDGSVVYGPFNTNSFTASINVGPLSTKTYTVTTITGNGCDGTPSGAATVTVNAIPEATLSLSGDDIICNGENSSFQISFNGVAPYTYTYFAGSASFGPFTATSNPETIQVTPGSTTTYSLSNISDNKCAGTISGTAQVTVNPLPVATVTGNPSICNGSSTSFNVGFTGTGPFTYTYSNGTVTSGPITTSNNPEIITVNPNLTTTYTVVTVNDANCVGSANGSSTVTVYQIPSASISGTNVICAGDNTPLTFNFNGIAPFTYTYNNGVTNVGPLTSANPTATIPVTPGASTTYTLVSLNDAHCAGTLSGSASITVNPLPQPVISGDFEICDGQTSTLTTSLPYVSYQWITGAVTPSVVSSTPGIYVVTVTDNNGCVGSSPAINFVVYQTPVISFTNDTSLTCEIPEINFTNNSSYPAGSVFAWEFGDNSTSDLVNPSHIFNTPGNYPITLTISTPNGCTATSTQPVEITFFPLPEARFKATPLVTNVFDSKVNFTDESQNAVTWLWDFNDGALSMEQNPYHYFNDIGQYYVKLLVTNIAGCRSEYMQEVVVNPFYIPNAFTPNADGINDYFFDAGYVMDVQSYKMEIFNRWGQMVYSNNDYTKFWTGFEKDGEAAPQGVYVYSIEVLTKGGKTHQFNGTVTLIR